MQSYLTTLNHALPSEKDIIAVYSSLATLARNNNIQISNFSVKLGNYYTKSIQAVSQNNVQPSFFIIHLDLGSTSSKGIVNFVKNVYRSLPVAEVSTFNAAQAGGAMEVAFYYKPYNPTLLSQQTSPTSLSGADIDLIKNLSSWNTASQ